MTKKVYGQSQKLFCPFCGGTSVTKNHQNLPTCQKHSSLEIDFKCVCKSWLDVKESKYGTFFLCENCGPISYSKALDMNDLPLKRVEEL